MIDRHQRQLFAISLWILRIIFHTFYLKSSFVTAFLPCAAIPPRTPAKAASVFHSGSWTRFSPHHLADDDNCDQVTTVSHSCDTKAAIVLSSLSSSSTASLALTPLEKWFVENLQNKYNEALSIKCPFFRRRAADLLDGIDMLIRFLIVRHKSLPLEPPGWRCYGDIRPKQTGLSRVDLMEVIRKDWRPDTNKGYYITAKLSTPVYRDDCVFDGPDPDMPVRGIRKYLNAASQLFDHQKSQAELLSLTVQNEVIVAKWRMNGVLMLPWRPSVPTWTGSTTYYTDDDGLIYRHVETWDKSVLQAFLQTLLPELADRIWERNANVDLP